MSPARDERRQAVLGEVVVSRHRDPATGRDRVHIDRADPQARITVELVSEIRDVRSSWAHCSDDGVLTLTDDYGQRFIYRIDWDSFDAKTWSYAMEWPD